MEEIRNAKIRAVRLGIEDHGILTATIDLDYGGAGQGFGNFALDRYDPQTKKRVGDPACGTFIRRCLDVFEIRWWERLPGTPCRVEIADGRVRRIGHYLKDQWFDPGEELK